MIGAGIFLLGVTVGIAFLAICNAWDRAGSTLDTLVRPEPATRPTSSSRKAGRTGVRG